jgi:hypothetical protein
MEIVAVSEHKPLKKKTASVKCGALLQEDY